VEAKLELAENAIEDVVIDFFHYDRINDSEFTVQDLRELIDSKDLTKEIIIQWFINSLDKHWREE
jgi:hypothetical protein